MSVCTITLPAVQSPHAEKPCPADRQAVLIGTPTTTEPALPTLTVKGTERSYALFTLPCDFGRGWRMVKEADGECYDLHTDNRFPGAVECECQGYLRWQHCKHSDAVMALVTGGQL
jgi:hypothetical protein